MTLFYTLLHATFLTSYLWAATAGGEEAENDDFLTKMFKSCSASGLIVNTIGLEKWEEMKINVRAIFAADVPASFHLTTPEEFWVVKSKETKLTPSVEDKFKYHQSVLLLKVYQAFYESEIEKLKPKRSAFAKSMDILDSTQEHWQHIQQQIREAKASAKPEETLIALLPEVARSAGLDKKKLEKEEFMLFSEPVVASPAWDALTEAEKAQRYLDNMTVFAMTLHGIPE